MKIKDRKLKNGEKIPEIGFGTWNLAGKTVLQSVEEALEAGYNHIDTAEGYSNESEIGEVLKNYDRSKLFLTSKVLPSNLNYENVINSCKKSLEKLNTSYLDLYLIHWPNPAISLRETLWAMNSLYEKNLVKSIGVSNFSLYQLKIAQKISPLPLTVNQVEFHPWWNQNKLLDYCLDNDIVLTAAAPLARTEVLSDKTIIQLSTKYDKTPAQIVLKWELAKKIIPIPKSSTKEHIRQNIKIYDWDMSAEDLKLIDNIGRKKQVYQLSIDDEVYGISD